MAMPSDFVLVGAAVVALAPKSHGPILMWWARKYAIDEFGRDFLDTLGRFFLYCWMVLACSLVEKILNILPG